MMVTRGRYPMHVHWKMWYSPNVSSPTPNASDAPHHDTITVLWPGTLDESMHCTKSVDLGGYIKPA